MSSLDAKGKRLPVINMPVNKALQFLLALLLSSLAVGSNLPAFGQEVKPWESYGIRLDGSPYDIKVRVRVTLTRATEQTEIAHWQGYWPANLAAQVSHQPEAQALGDLRVYASQSGCAAPFVFGHIGGKYDTTFLYSQDLGAVGRLMDFMGEVPEPAVVVEGDRFGWRGVGIPGGWKPAREVLVSEGYLFLKHGTLATPTLRARWYLQCLAALYEKIAPKLAKVDDWGRQHQKEAADILTKEIGLELPIVELATQRFSWGAKPVTDQVIAEQQKIADTFSDLKLIPKKLVVKDAVLKDTVVGTK